MKVTRLAVRNFCGAFRIDVEPKEPVAIICGSNGAGKSSVAEALRIAFHGDGARVIKSSDWPMLVSEGTREAVIALHVEHDEGKTIKRVSLPDGISTSDGPPMPEPEYLPYVLDPTLFASVPADERRMLLFGLLGANITPDAVEQILIEREVGELYASEAASMVHGGFDVLHDYATEQAKVGRAAWKAITGETYGSRKAEGWVAPVPEFSAEYLDHLVLRMSEVGPELEGVQRALGAIEERMRFAARAAQAQPCAHCGGLLMIQGDRLDAYQPPTDAKRNDLVILEGEYAAARKHADELRSVLDALTVQRREQEINQAHAVEAEKRTEAAAGYHRDVQQWTRVADLAAPDGLPTELLQRALVPFNAALRNFAASNGFAQVALTPALGITANGRPYTLLSKSEKWRADLTLAVAVAHFSGLRFVAADEFDVLDGAGRNQALHWLEHLVQHTELDGAFLFATLRTLPPNEPGFMEAYWIATGENERKREAV
ncbi:AAA family ATPase [Burkholderia sp. LMG 21824]|uniref:AAA family ATPase n=1 Tax=Burkholderia sp. LMG 21824 TaxID=3158172 RepID=UPI003C2F5293